MTLFQSFIFTVIILTCFMMLGLGVVLMIAAINCFNPVMFVAGMAVFVAGLTCLVFIAGQ